MNANKFCVAVPTCLTHFIFASSLLESYNRLCDSDIDFCFIFSNNAEYKLFYDLHQSRFKFKSIIIPPISNENIITFKKFYAVHNLLKIYSHIIILDDESLFVRNVSVEDFNNEIKNSFKSNRISNVGIQNTVKQLATYMNYQNSEILLSQTDNFTQYWWFNDLCIYDSNFYEFYNWYKQHENYSDLSTHFMCFDYLMYSMWLIVNKGYTINKHMLKYTFNGAALESNYDDDEISLNFMSIIDRNNNYQTLDHIKIQMMLDRDIVHCRNTNQKTIYET